MEIAKQSLSQLLGRSFLATAVLCSSTAASDEPDYSGDVSDVRTIRHVEQYPQAWRIWQPFIVQGDKKNHLLVAFGAMRRRVWGQAKCEEMLALKFKRNMACPRLGY